MHLAVFANVQYNALLSKNGSGIIVLN